MLLSRDQIAGQNWDVKIENRQQVPSQVVLSFVELVQKTRHPYQKSVNKAQSGS
jgi:hypothetical protein